MWWFIFLSIPPWSDFFAAYLDEELHEACLSIPPWSDFFLKRWVMSDGGVHLSIPPWSDFFCPEFDEERDAILTFNPTLV